MSTISASTTSTTAFKITTDTTGALVFQTGASPTTAMTISSAQVVSLVNPLTFPNGTAAAPAITGTDTDTGIFFPSANTLAFSTNGTEDARFDASGNFLVGTTSASYSVSGRGLIEVNGSSESLIAFKIGGGTTNAVYQYNNATNFETNVLGSRYCNWTVNGSERMRLDSSGNLGLGITPSAWGTTTLKAIQMGGGALALSSGGAGAGDGSLTWNGYYNGTNWIYVYTGGAASRFRLNESGAAWFTAASGTAGNTISFTQAMTLDASGNFMVGQTSSGGSKLSVTGTGSSNTGVLALNATDTSATFVWASQSYISGMTAGQNFIHMIGKSGSTKNSGYIGYKWAADASNSNLLTFGHYGNDNLVNIDAAGNLLVNTTTRTAASINSSGTLQVNREMMAVGSLAGIFWENRSGSVTSSSNWYGWYASGSTILLYNGNANIASINTTSGAYTALSDANKKKDFEDSGIGLAAVMQLKPTLFRMLDDAEDAPKQLGFIAQEVNEVIPQAYVESTMVDAGGKNSTYIGLNDRPIIAALTKAIQELNAKVIALENK